MISIKKLLFFSLPVLLAGCASHYTDATYYDPYGIFSGIWHGAIAPLTICINIISWLLSLFNIDFLSDIQIIGRPNTGFFYYLGFFLGLCLDSGASSQRGS